MKNNEFILLLLIISLLPLFVPVLIKKINCINNDQIELYEKEINCFDCLDSCMAKINNFVLIDKEEHIDIIYKLDQYDILLNKKRKDNAILCGVSIFIGFVIGLFMKKLLYTDTLSVIKRKEYNEKKKIERTKLNDNTIKPIDENNINK